MEKDDSTTVHIELTRKESKGKAPLLAPPPFIASTSSVKQGKGRGYKRGVAIFDLVLRLGALIAALTATITMGTTDQTLPFFTQFFQFEASYDDLPAFEFFVIANAIVCGYLVLSVPFSIVCIVRPQAKAPRLLLIIMDTVMATLMTSAAGSATAIVQLAHEGNSSANWLPICQQFTDFCQKVSGAVVAAFVAVAFFIFMIVLSACAL